MVHRALIRLLPKFSFHCDTPALAFCLHSPAIPAQIGLSTGLLLLNETEVNRVSPVRIKKDMPHGGQQPQVHASGRPP